MTRVPTDPRDPRWGWPGWPAHITSFRQHQLDAVEEILQCYDDGCQIVLCEAPTGSGKTIIAEMVRRLLRVRRAAYVANTNSLLDQFTMDFDYAAPIKGKSNYPTLDAPKLFEMGRDSISCAECTLTLTTLPACDTCTTSGVMFDDDPLDDGETDEKKGPHCQYCHPVSACPYRAARERTRDHFLAVTNTAYFLTECSLDDTAKIPLSVMNNRDLVIIDECDTVESILMGQIEVNISRTTAKKLDINPPEKKTVEESWIEWCETEAKPKMKAALEAMPSKRSCNVKQRKERESLERLYGKVCGLTKELAESNAIYDGYKEGAIIFKPIKVAANAPSMLWSRAARFLAMSATVFPAEFIESTGVDLTGLRTGLVVVPSTFPVKSRPIYIKPIANNTFKERETAWPAMIGGLNRVFAKHPEDRTLVHTVSYGFTEFIMGELLGIDRPVFTYTKANQRDEALRKYRAQPGAILLAPSMDRGIDLKGDDCRVIVIPKIPYASTADKQINARIYSQGGQQWYAVQTIKSLIQMTGRGMRSEDDWCFSYILDKQFIANVYRNAKKLIPEWWMDSVNFGGGGI